MEKDILQLKPQNLPVYVYSLEADIALVHDRIAYKLRAYSFDNIKVASNQPLRPGDVLCRNSCYYGNEYTEIIPHLQKKCLLGGAEIELRYYYGCQIDRLAISYVDENSIWDSCGAGYCTVYIELSPGELNAKLQSLYEREDELTEAECDTLESLRQEYLGAKTLDYWKKRIPDWDKRLECIGEVPTNLIY
jgi:hypothetical protein